MTEIAEAKATESLSRKRDQLGAFSPKSFLSKFPFSY